MATTLPDKLAKLPPERRAKIERRVAALREQEMRLRELDKQSTGEGGASDAT